MLAALPGTLFMRISAGPGSPRNRQCCLLSSVPDTALMHKRNYIPLGIILGLFSWAAESFLHWFSSAGETFEIIPTDLNELWMRVFIFILLVCFGVYADYHTKALVARQEETRKIFKATTAAFQHILNNFLNEILYFRDEAERVGGFDENTQKLLERAVKKAADRVDSLRNMSDISVENIKVSVNPEQRE
ncbi:MAG: hypothetical protein A2W28_01390 [Gammaproteobacteria bacterium RBG_16_51_14]|nr:MAG: hypothetical protein A2W28_01390 [Gammaproteobacteria bacterium RBG_16_51_14]